MDGEQTVSFNDDVHRVVELDNDASLLDALQALGLTETKKDCDYG